MNTLTENRAFLDVLTEKLIEKETIDYKELLEMREEHGVASQITPLMPSNLVAPMSVLLTRVRGLRGRGSMVGREPGLARVHLRELSIIISIRDK
jgi:hypothetical protein